MIRRGASGASDRDGLRSGAEVLRGDPALHGWLRELEAGLVGSRRWRTGVVAELADGLAEALERHRRGTPAEPGGGAGPGDRSACLAVLREFGAPGEVAAGFVQEAVAARAQQVGWAVLASGPLAAAGWLVSFGAGVGPLREGRLDGPWWAMPLLALALAVVIPAAASVVVLARWRADRSAPAAVLAAGRAELAAAGVFAVDVLMVGMFTAWSTSGAVAGLGVGVFAGPVVSAARMPAAGWAGWACHTGRGAAVAGARQSVHGGTEPR